MKFTVTLSKYHCTLRLSNKKEKNYLIIVALTATIYNVLKQKISRRSLTNQDTSYENQVTLPLEYDLLLFPILLFDINI